MHLDLYLFTDFDVDTNEAMDLMLKSGTSEARNVPLLLRALAQEYKTAKQIRGTMTVPFDVLEHWWAIASDFHPFTMTCASHRLCRSMRCY